MIGTISGNGLAQSQRIPDIGRASEGFAHLMAHVVDLYCAGGSSSISTHEAHELAASVAYVLGIADTTPDETACILDVDDPVALWHEAIQALEGRTDAVLALWREAVATMPPIRNVALRDTLASLGNIKKRYNVYFAAHEVPCDIDYQLSVPVDQSLLGLDYVEVWLAQLLAETRWIAQFDTASCVTVLERVCPDYRGLHVNLYDLLLPHEGKLAPAGAAASRRT
ncbi:DUF6179 domain-containing protein [Adlercreutzia sp. ZJ141]|uniref:DUF6179 domain-containing protein n=1 Tax=Adlercreutzia sp. ZJ141 TaxID=2709406 RepID=UPI0013EAA633|nr:DUF6179 domain-containing protein [Adlercreutzia sp. ZJ141]